MRERDWNRGLSHSFQSNTILCVPLCLPAYLPVLSFREKEKEKEKDKTRPTSRN